MSSNTLVIKNMDYLHKYIRVSQIYNNIVMLNITITETTTIITNTKYTNY